MSTNSNLHRVSVVIPTHNPRMDYLARVLEALRVQTLPREHWEIVVVDNNSTTPLSLTTGHRDDGTTGTKAAEVDLSWHANARIVREKAVGLTNARLRGFAETTGEVIVLVDDDNVLAADYLEQVVRIAREYPFLGTWSGNVILELDPGAPEPPRELRHLLCERIVERDLWSNDPSHFRATPWGAGECIRREVARTYTEKVERDPRRRQLDLQGGQLVYGGDTDIAYTGLEMGLGMGVFTRLRVSHLTPASRCRDEYFLRRHEGKAFSEVLHGWISTGALPGTRRADLLGRLGECFRWLFAGRMGRKLMAARRRGLRKAERLIADGG
jgi:hypothetical protein